MSRQFIYPSNPFLHVASELHSTSFGKTIPKIKNSMFKQVFSYFKITWHLSFFSCPWSPWSTIKNLLISVLKWYFANLYHSFSNCLFDKKHLKLHQTLLITHSQSQKSFLLLLCCTLFSLSFLKRGAQTGAQYSKTDLT